MRDNQKIIQELLDDFKTKRLTVTELEEWIQAVTNGIKNLLAEIIA